MSTHSASWTGALQWSNDISSTTLALESELDDSGLLRILNPKSSEKPKTKSASVTHMAENGTRSLRSGV